MNIEERLGSSLHTGLDRVEVPVGDPVAAIRRGEQVRRRRSWVTRLAAAAAVAVVVTGIGIGLGDRDRDRLEPAPPSGDWTKLPEAPLSPRTGGIAVWTGTEALFLGGEVDNLCPPTADCVAPSVLGRDGAAYDPTKETWRRISDAPVGVGAHTPRVLVDGTLVIVGDKGSWHAYDVSEDRWRDLPAPPLNRPTPLDVDTGLTALDGRIYTIGKGAAVQILDLAAASWSVLPASPHRPVVEAHYVTATPEGIVLMGVDSTAKNDGTEPSYLLAEVYRDGAWERLGHSDVLGGWGGWHWTGERLVSPYLECVDGGEVNPYGRCIPTGGTLDPATGTWGPLPDVPSPGRGGWTLTASSGPLIATWGYLYDDAAGSWTRLHAPKGAGELNGVASVFAGDTLIAFGGVDWSQGTDDWEHRLSNRAWSLTP